jgi:hypothetical protein
MLRILGKIHVGSETSGKQGSGYGSEQKSFRIHNTVVCRAVARYTRILSFTCIVYNHTDRLFKKNNFSVFRLCEQIFLLYVLQKNFSERERLKFQYYLIPVKLVCILMNQLGYVRIRAA